VFRKCNSFQINNYYTGNDECKYDFTKYLLYSTIQSEPIYTQNCRKCGFLWLKKCCERVYVAEGQRSLNLYACNRNNTVEIQSTYVFGGSYTTQKVNPVTNAFTCPIGFTTAYKFDDITICLAERITTSTKHLPRYGGIYSCQYGNIATGSFTKACTEGFSSYAMGTIDGTCFLDVCLKFEKPDSIRSLPAVALPPFFKIDTTHAILNTNQTNENITVSARMIGDQYISSAATANCNCSYCATLIFYMYLITFFSFDD